MALTFKYSLQFIWIGAFSYKAHKATHNKGYVTTVKCQILRGNPQFVASEKGQVFVWKSNTHLLTAVGIVLGFHGFSAS